MHTLVVRCEMSWSSCMIPLTTCKLGESTPTPARQHPVISNEGVPDSGHCTHLHSPKTEAVARPLQTTPLKPLSWETKSRIPAQQLRRRPEAGFQFRFHHSHRQESGDPAIRTASSSSRHRRFRTCCADGWRSELRPPRQEPNRRSRAVTFYGFQLALNGVVTLHMVISSTSIAIYIDLSIYLSIYEQQHEHQTPRAEMQRVRA
jgi:hypothetical protein